MGTQWTTRQKIAINIANRTNFRFGNISGQWSEEFDLGSFGRLPDFLRDQLKAAAKDKDLYIVRSYLTPIGWANDREWFIPEVKYSNTTTHHQSILQVAILDNSPYLP